MAEGRDYSISVLDCALRALEELLVADGQGLGLSAIAARLGLNKSRAFRILATLEQQGFVIQDTETKNYRLGLKLLQFGEAVRQSLRLPEVAAPLLDQLAAATGETVFLGVIDGSEAVCIAKRESKHPVRLYAEIGRRAPLHAGGVPRVLLAYRVLEQPQLLDNLPLTPITSATQTDRARLAEELAQIRAQGFGVAINDLDMGVTSVAAPIRNHQSRVVAAVSVAGPNDRLPADQLPALAALVRTTAAQISQGLGARLCSDPSIGQS